MCVAITMEPGAELSLDEVVKMGRTNGDGIGVAWAEDGVVNWTKAVNYMPHQAHNFINSYKGYFRLVHFRLSTAGGVISQLCHPFEIGPFAACSSSGHGTKALIHNGHWHRWTDVFDILKKEDALPDKGPWSDSRLMAYLAYHDPDWLLTVGGRVAVMDGDGNTTRYGDWQDLRDGIKVSNKSWDHGFVYTRRGRDREWAGWGWTEEHWQEKEAHEAELAREAAEKAKAEKDKADGEKKEQTSTQTAGGANGKGNQKVQGQGTTGTAGTESGTDVHMVSHSGGPQRALPPGDTAGGGRGSNHHGGDGEGAGNGIPVRPSAWSGKGADVQAPAGREIKYQAGQGKHASPYTVPGVSPVTYDHQPWQNPDTGRWYWIPPESVVGRTCRVQEISADRAREIMGKATPSVPSSTGGGSGRGN